MEQFEGSHILTHQSSLNFARMENELLDIHKAKVIYKLRMSDLAFFLPANN